MAEYDGDGLAVAAARILLSLRTRKLTRWPDWILPPSKELAAPAERPSAEPEVELPPPLPEGWPKRPRGPLRVRGSGWSLSLDGLLARLLHPAPARSGASPTSSEGERPPKREPLAEAAARTGRPSEAYGSASGSGGVARPPPRVTVKVAARKESAAAAFMAASSPETPFDYAAAARSGASSSGDEGARSAKAKRKARGASRSGAPSSGDEGCSSSPAKRTRADSHGAAQDASAPLAVKVEVPTAEENYRDERGHLLFDLNEDISMAW